MPAITRAQQIVLTTLYDVATHEGGPIILKNRYHSAAAALMRRGLVEQLDRWPYRPGYQLTAAGLAHMQANGATANAE
jgi:hypothetical protein